MQHCLIKCLYKLAWCFGTNVVEQLSIVFSFACLFINIMHFTDNLPLALLLWQEFAVGGVVFLTCHCSAGASAGSECRSVSRLGLLIENR